jgi:hypothetical protein
MLGAIVGGCSRTNHTVRYVQKPTQKGGMARLPTVDDILCVANSSNFRRQLSEPQKKSYIDAVLCLSHTKAKSGIEGALNRFDDHQAVHMLQKPQNHWVVCQIPAV